VTRGPRGRRAADERRRSPGPVSVVAAGLAALGALGGCTGVRSDLGTSSSPCYVALPAATTAVHHSGKLIGVRLATVPSLRHFRRLYAVAHTTAASGQPVGRVCLVAFMGHYTSAVVDKPRGRRHGTVAIAVLSYQGNQLLGTVLFKKVPERFGHSHVL